MNLLYIVVAGIAGILIGRKMAMKKVFAPRTKKEKEIARKESRLALSERTDDRKEKILGMMQEAREDFKEGCNLREGENKKGITREEVEKLLNVSSGTALKYLNELEKEKKIEQIGFSGKGVHYTPVE